MTDTEFNPGEGWRRTFRQEAIHHGDYLHMNFANEGASAVYWIRENPVPSLPTEPYTVIRVTWDDGHKDDWPSVLVLGVSRNWAWSPVGGPGFIDVNDLPKWITGFEVLAEPRAVTAKAVLLSARDEIEGDDALGGDLWEAFVGTAQKFGVEL